MSKKRQNPTPPPAPMHPDEEAMLARLRGGAVTLTLDSGGARIVMAHLRRRGLAACAPPARDGKFVWSLVAAPEARR